MFLPMDDEILRRQLKFPTTHSRLPLNRCSLGLFARQLINLSRDTNEQIVTDNCESRKQFLMLIIARNLEELSDSAVCSHLYSCPTMSIDCSTKFNKVSSARFGFVFSSSPKKTALNSIISLIMFDWSHYRQASAFFCLATSWIWKQCRISPWFESFFLPSSQSALMRSSIDARNQKLSTSSRGLSLEINAMLAAPRYASLT